MPSPDVLVSSPFPIDSAQGNSVSARRIAGRIADLGWRTELTSGYQDQEASILIALHARRGAEAVEVVSKRPPGNPIVLVLTGTDLYKDLPNGDRTCVRSMELADALVIYQEASAEAVPARFHDKLHTIWKSVDLPIPDALPPPAERPLTLTILAHLRTIKDPFLPAAALSRLPGSMEVRIDHFGVELEPGLAAVAREWMRREPRYRWHPPLDRERVAAAIVASHATINSGRAEGGSNAISESIVQGTPVLASQIPANVGFLGESYAGYFAAGDVEGLAALIERCCDTDSMLLAQLARQVEARAPLFQAETESTGWKSLIGPLLRSSPRR